MRRLDKIATQPKDKAHLSKAECDRYQNIAILKSTQKPEETKAHCGAKRDHADYHPMMKRLCFQSHLNSTSEKWNKDGTSLLCSGFQESGAHKSTHTCRRSISNDEWYAYCYVCGFYYCSACDEGRLALNRRNNAIDDWPGRTTYYRGSTLNEQPSSNSSSWTRH